MLTRKVSIGMLAVFFSVTLAGAATIPRQSPEFAMNTVDGKQILLSQYRGKAVVFAFILTTCPHCQQTIGILSKLQPEYAARGVQVLACAIEDAARQNVPGFIAKFHPPFPVGYSPRDSVYEYLQHPSMLILHMPALVFIDRHGSIRAQYEGDAPFFAGDAQEKDVREEIEKLLKEGNVTSKTTHHKGGAARATK
jgi:peroxiredoxin